MNVTADRTWTAARLPSADKAAVWIVLAVLLVFAAIVSDAFLQLNYLVQSRAAGGPCRHHGRGRYLRHGDARRRPFGRRGYFNERGDLRAGDGWPCGEHVAGAGDDLCGRSGHRPCERTADRPRPGFGIHPYPGHVDRRLWSCPDGNRRNGARHRRPRLSRIPERARGQCACRCSPSASWRRCWPASSSSTAPGSGAMSI